MKPHVDSLMRQVPGAVDKLDNYACGRIDNLTSAIPALADPTPQLVESTKEAVIGYIAIMNEYLASFTAAQISLSIVDKSLSVVEKSVNFFKPDEQDSGVLCRTSSKIRLTHFFIKNFLPIIKHFCQIHDGTLKKLFQSRMYEKSKFFKKCVIFNYDILVKTPNPKFKKQLSQL